jgi:hypothetical protein
MDLINIINHQKSNLSQKLGKEISLSLERACPVDLEELAVWLDSQLDGSKKVKLPPSFYRKECDDLLKIIVYPLWRLIEEKPFSWYLYKYVGYEDLDDTKYLNYSSLRYATYVSSDRVAECFIIPKYLSYGDYDLSTAIERSNYSVFLDKYGDMEGVYEVTGGYNSRGIALRLDSVDKDDMFDTFLGLEEYPILDEDHHSGLEHEMVEEAWENYGYDDLARALEREFDIEDIPSSPENFLPIIRRAIDSLSEYPHVEGGGNVNLLISKIVKKISRQDIEVILGD